VRRRAARGLATCASTANVGQALGQDLFKFFATATLKEHLPRRARSLIFDVLEGDFFAVLQQDSLIGAVLALPGFWDFSLGSKHDA
jgi:hypothetical protein